MENPNAYLHDKPSISGLWIELCIWIVIIFFNSEWTGIRLFQTGDLNNYVAALEINNDWMLKGSVFFCGPVNGQRHDTEACTEVAT